MASEARRQLSDASRQGYERLECGSLNPSRELVDAAANTSVLEGRRARRSTYPMTTKMLAMGTNWYADLRA